MEIDVPRILEMMRLFPARRLFDGFLSPGHPLHLGEGNECVENYEVVEHHGCVYGGRTFPLENGLREGMPFLQEVASFV